MQKDIFKTQAPLALGLNPSSHSQSLSPLCEGTVRIESPLVWQEAAMQMQAALLQVWKKGAWPAASLVLAC